jgi:hypothetical protein
MDEKWSNWMKIWLQENEFLKKIAKISIFEKQICHLAIFCQ